MTFQIILPLTTNGIEQFRALHGNEDYIDTQFFLTSEDGGNLSEGFCVRLHDIDRADIARDPRWQRATKRTVAVWVGVDQSAMDDADLLTGPMHPSHVRRLQERGYLR